MANYQFTMTVVSSIPSIREHLAIQGKARRRLTNWCPSSVKTRIQATDDKKGKGKAKALSVSALLVKILQDEGLGGYYKGFGASMLNTFSMRESVAPEP